MKMHVGTCIAIVGVLMMACLGTRWGLLVWLVGASVIAWHITGDRPS